METSEFPPGPSLKKYAYMYIAERFDYLRLAKRLLREYGDIVHVQSGNRHHYFINHPDYIEQVLTAGYKMRTSRPRPLRHTIGRGQITSQGELHRTMRRILQPYFQKQPSAEKIPIFIEEAERILSTWRSGETRDMAEEMTHLTLGVILRVMIGTNCADEIEKMGKAGDVIHRYMHQNPASHINMRIEWIPFLGKFTPAARARRYFDEKIYGIMRERRATGNLEGPDMLSMLMRVQKTHPEIKDLSDKQIRDELLTVFIAGHETAATALAWIWYLLSEHPEIERKLHEEVDRVLAGRMPTAEDIPNLVYVRKVFLESMRLYPPVWTLGRRPEVEGLRIGRYVIPRKSTVLLSPYFAHHDERFFPDPERFDPERFEKEEEAKRPKYSYIPFGAGNRKCLGENFGWIEVIILLATLTQRWRFRLVKGHPIALAPLISLKPKYGIRMVLEKRSPALPAKPEPAKAYTGTP